METKVAEEAVAEEAAVVEETPKADVAELEAPSSEPQAEEELEAPSSELQADEADEASADAEGEEA